MSRAIFTGLIALFLLRVASAAVAAAPVLRSTGEINRVGAWNLREPHPLRLDGTLTWVDRERHLLVIQDDAGALALEVEADQLDFRPGRRVVVEAADSWPTFPTVADFPVRPSGRELPTAFEGPSNWSTNYVARYRGYVYPPKTGTYRFWITSDDTSELWLGTDDNPATAQPVASVATWVTKPREWNHLPSQQSAPVALEAGRRYYIEALHEQRWSTDHLSVAWDGPDLPLQLIAGNYLSPWIEPADGVRTVTPTRGGILREYWFNRSVENATKLGAPRSLTSTLALSRATIRDLGPAAMPAPRLAQPGEPWKTEDNFRWSETGGTVEFMASRGDTLVLELADGPRRTRVMVEWRGDSPPRLNGRRVRLRGIAEAGLNDAGEAVLSTLWVPATSPISVAENSPQPGDARQIGIAELLSREPSAFRDRLVRLRGRVVESTDGRLVLGDAGSFQGFTSTDGTNWKPLGVPVEIAMSETVEIGLVVTSRSTEKSATAVFDHIEGLGETPMQTAVGSPTHTGGLSRRDGSTTLRGVGHDIWISPDQFYFAHRPLKGAGEIVAHIAQFDAADPWAKGGLMIRESTAADAQFVDLVQTGANGCCLQWRRNTDGSAPLSLNDSTLRAPHWLKLARNFAHLAVSGVHLAGFSVGQQIEVTGYVAGENGQIAISDAFARELSDENQKPPSSAPTRPLVELASILGPAGNALRYDVFQARGLVTFAGDVGGHSYLAVQDHSGATFVTGNIKPQGRPLFAGQFVEVHSNPGWTSPSPTLTAAHIYVLGDGVVPAPLRHPVEYSLPRRGEGSWIELEGVVRAVSANGLIELKEASELFSMAVSGAAAETLRRLIDARVRVRGVIAYPSEHERLLLVPSADQIEIMEAAPAQPFASPARAIADFTPATLVNQSVHRVKIVGTVTFLDRQFLYLQDATGGARVEFAATAAVKIGDEIEAVGFPDFVEDRSLLLEGATIRRVRAGAELAPLSANAEQILSGRFGARLIRVEAVVSRTRLNESDATFELQLEGRIFRASLDEPTANLPSIPPGSVVSVTGVCALEVALPDWIKVSAGAASILPMRLLLRSADDFKVLQKPRAWAVKRTLIATSVVIFVLGVSLVWIHILRRRVAQRTAELRAAMEKLQRETQTAATLAERNRLAGEIHDSLEQGFSGLILQLDTTAKHGQCPTEVRSGLTLARNMVAFSRNEVRHAVWDLQSPVLEGSDLGTALKKIAALIAPETPHTTVTVEGRVCPLSSTIEHHLLRIAQEAIANTVKHAGARHLDVTLTYSEHEIVLLVRDDGCGFVPAEVLTGGLGHFGLRSLRGRANKIRSTLTISSQPRQGTTIEVRVTAPLNGQNSTLPRDATMLSS